MRTLPLLLALAACEEHGSTKCTAQAPCLDAVFPNPDPDNDPSMCADDSAFGSNDSPQGAFAIPLQGNNTFSIAGLAICPFGDVDHYAVDLPGNVGLSAAAMSATARLDLALLDGAGSVLASAVPGGGETRVCMPLLPGGKFFVRASSGGIVAGYRLSFQAVTSCP